MKRVMAVLIFAVGTLIVFTVMFGYAITMVIKGSL